MPSISFKYIDSGITYSRTFASALSVKGFKPGDGHVQFPRERNEYLNGSLRKKQAGFRRIFEVDLGVLTDTDDLAFLGGWLASENQYVTFTYGSTTETDLRVVDNAQEYESQWINNVEIGRQVYLGFEDANLLTEYPSGTPTPLLEDLNLFFTKKVPVTGTPASPQTFTLGPSGSGTLLTQEGGSDYPTVDDAVYYWRVEISSPYQEAPICITTAPTLDGSDYVTFALCASNFGSASSDGAYYCDVTLWLKAQ